MQSRYYGRGQPNPVHDTWTIYHSTSHSTSISISNKFQGSAANHYQKGTLLTAPRLRAVNPDATQRVLCSPRKVFELADMLAEWRFLPLSVHLGCRLLG